MQGAKYKILRLSKENFKFSSAHFLIFDAQRAERLHGHNYRVLIETKIGAEEIGTQGYGIDFSILKKIVKDQMDQWDEHVLLPGKNPEIRTQCNGNELEVHFRDRRYVFPKEEVLLLPLQNTSVELLSELLAEELWKPMAPLGVIGLMVQVEETSGQAAKSMIGQW